MAASLLFSQEMMSTYTNTSTAPKQPVPRNLPITHIPSSKATSANDLNHWLSQQQLSNPQQIPRIMSNNNHDSYSASSRRVDDVLNDEYIFTTHAPNDELSLWPPSHSHLFHPDMQNMHMPLNIQTTGHHPRPSPSPTYSDTWTDYSYSGPTDLTSNSTGFILGDTYSPQSNVNNLSPFSVQPRTPSSLPQLSPSNSDPSLSPLYSASPRLPTPSTPGSATGSFIGSPTLSENMNNMLVLDPQVMAGNPERQRFTHREQLQKFRDAINLPMDGAGPFVPQQMYKPHTTSDRKRYVEEVLLEGPLYFTSEHPVQCGIPLKDALHSRTKKLRDRDQVVFEGRGPSVSIRLEWPGYRQWSRQIPTKDFRSPPQPITLAKLAKNVAKCVQRFMQDRKSLPMEEDADPRWRIGDGADDIKLEDLVLVSIHHVSLGSWQPHLRLVRPSRRHGHALPMPTHITASHASPSANLFPVLS